MCLGEVVWRRSLYLYRWFVGKFTMAASSECYGDVAAFLRDFQPRYLALVLAEQWCCSGGGDRDVGVVVMVIQLWW